MQRATSESDADTLPYTETIPLRSKFVGDGNSVKDAENGHTPVESVASACVENAPTPAQPPRLAFLSYYPWWFSTLIAGGIFVLIAGLLALTILRAGDQYKSNAIRIQNSAAQFTQLDKRLTESARKAAQVGDENTSADYESVSQQLIDSLRTLLSLTLPRTPLQEAIQAMIGVTQERISTEQGAINLAANGKPFTAQAILNGPVYRDQRTRFLQIQTRLIRATRSEIEGGASLARIGMATTGSAAFLAFALLGLSGYGFQRGRRIWGKEAHDSHKSLRKAEEELSRTLQQMEAIKRELRRVEETRSNHDRDRRTIKERDRQLWLLEQAVEAADDVVMIAEADAGSHRVVRVNRAFERMTGYSAAEIYGRSPRILQGPETDAEEIEQVRAKLRAHEPIQAELLNYRKDGTTFWVQLNIQPVFDDNQELKYWISVQRDVTLQRATKEEFRWQATHDVVTRLPNRNLFQDKLCQAVADAENNGSMVGVLFLDLDDFKKVNDSLGHSAGDKLLQLVADRLSHHLPAGAVMSRFGGDEFTFVLPNITGQSEAAVTAQSLLEEMDATPFMVEGHEMNITASVGISMAPTDGRDIETLLKNADTAMYRAKEQRHSFRLYTETMNARALDRLQVEAQLRRAVERDEFFLLYQPQVDLRTGRVFGVEALLRWENPVLGRVSPGLFVPIAEDKGWILEIGEWVLFEACRQAAEWYRQGRSIRMSVNLSARQFAQDDLPDRVKQALETNQLPNTLLDLELTETTLASGAEAEATLNRLKTLGVRLSVDDFGIGYSSFGYLRRLPLDVLKVDRTFVQGILDDHKSEVLVRHLIELAHNISFEVIAEGVETEAQKQVLVEMQCDAMQGYLFSPPTSAEQIEKLADEAEAEARRIGLLSSEKGSRKRRGHLALEHAA